MSARPIESDISPARLEVRNGVLVVQGYGVRLSVERGHLVVEDGIGERRSARLSRVTSGIRRVVVIGHSGSISLEALRWLHEIGAAFVQIGADGELIASGAPRALNDVKVRRGQAVAVLSDAAVGVARQLIVEKVQGQHALLDLIEDASRSRNLVEEALERATCASTVDELRFWESRAAAAYWKAWERIPVNFARRDSRMIPAHWQSFGTRSSVLTSSPRKAASPGNALLNYLYAILEAESYLAAIAVGCDPSMGVIHTDARSRDSFACDLMEPARPHADLYLLRLLRSQTFSRNDFFEMRDGNCRLMPDLAVLLADTASRWAKVIAPWAERMAGEFLRIPVVTKLPAGERRPELTRHRTPLTHRNRSKPKEKRQSESDRSLRPQYFGARCKECGVAMGRRKRVYCDACLPKQAAIASQKAAEKSALLRAVGDDKRSSPAVRAKHRASALRQSALNAAWEAQHRAIPSPTVFREDILPHLKAVPVRQLMAACGLSLSSCKKIRTGHLVPHPRHWPAFKKLVSD